MESAHFPVTFADLSASFVARELDGGRARVDDVSVRSFPQRHPGGSLGFGFAHAGREDVYSTDNEIDQRVLNADAVLADPETVRQFPGDVVDAVRGADLLIADAQYDDAEYPKKVGWGHACASTAVDLAVEAGVRQLALFHHDPMQSDHHVDRKVAACTARVARRGARDRLLVFGAREGMELKIV
jgi:phosphoribosyl 1,2-cyclic phosphodiesterase